MRPFPRVFCSLFFLASLLQMSFAQDAPAKRDAPTDQLWIAGSTAYSTLNDVPVKSSLLDITTAPKISLRLSGSQDFDQKSDVTVRDAILLNTLLVRISKTGMVRTRFGLVGTTVILSSQQLDCSKAQKDEYGEPGSKDFRIRAFTGVIFDPKEIEKDQSIQPFLYQQVEGKKGDLTLYVPEFVVTILDHGETAKGKGREFTNKSWTSIPNDLGQIRMIPNLNPKAPPWMYLTIKDGKYYVKIEAEDKKMSVAADLPVRKCPSIEQTYIQPK